LPHLRNSPATRRALLASGLASSLLYPAIDLLAGLSYEGYSFYSQTISELGAIGAPHPPWLLPVFLTYTLLVVTFAVAVILEGRGGNRKVGRIGWMLLGYMVVGSGTSIFPVHVRGTAVFADELPHIVTGLAAIAVIVATMAAGSVALGKGFRNFSWTMIATLLLFGALTVPFGMKLAAREPTPGIGVVERLAYYSIIVWIAGLSVALLRRAKPATEGAH
jgi:hypothetical protein